MPIHLSESPSTLKVGEANVTAGYIGTTSIYPNEFTTDFAVIGGGGASNDNVGGFGYYYTGGGG